MKLAAINLDMIQVITLLVYNIQNIHSIILIAIYLNTILYLFIQ